MRQARSNSTATVWRSIEIETMSRERGLLPDDAPPVARGTVLRDRHQISRDSLVGNQATRRPAAEIGAAELSVEKVLVADVEQPNDQPAPENRGAAGPIRPQEHVPRKEGINETNRPVPSGAPGVRTAGR